MSRVKLSPNVVVGRVRIPVFRLAQRISRNLPGTVRGLATDLREARQPESPGAEKVTPAEVREVVSHLFERLGQGVLPILLRENGLVGAGA